MDVVIAFNQPLSAAEPADNDVLVQVECVRAALEAKGHRCTTLGCSLDLRELQSRLHERRPDCVFNLVESLGGTDRLCVLVPILLDAMAISYTGASARSLLDFEDKLGAKQRLRALDLPTPDWDSDGHAIAGTYILKPRFEHASMGIDDSAVVQVDSAAALQRRLLARQNELGFRLFAERFVPGREFNIALYADSAGVVQVLPHAEIDFSAFPADKPRIVGYDAKWREASFEFASTPRSFDFAAADQPLLRTLTSLCRRVWSGFDLRGYARVDFRVDDQGQPFILEVNLNPCLSPDAGFQAAVVRAGIDFPAVADALVAAAVRQHPNSAVSRRPAS